ncbi:MAG: ACT domain-containing protein [Clostridiales bacterium]|nr:ACT domain-containing protein [Clostridiales bacterium]
MFIKQISVFVENKSGRLGEITSILAKAGIDIRALSIADTTSFGILRLIVDRPDEAEEALRTAGLTVSLTNVIAIGVPDQPGGFAAAAAALTSREVDIEYMYAFISRAQGRACVILRVRDNDRALEALREGGIELLRGEDIYTL